MDNKLQQQQHPKDVYKSDNLKRDKKTMSQRHYNPFQNANASLRYLNYFPQNQGELFRTPVIPKYERSDMRTRNVKAKSNQANKPNFNFKTSKNAQTVRYRENNQLPQNDRLSNVPRFYSRNDAHVPFYEGQQNIMPYHLEEYRINRSVYSINKLSSENNANKNEFFNNRRKSNSRDGYYKSTGGLQKLNNFIFLVDTPNLFSNRIQRNSEPSKYRPSNGASPCNLNKPNSRFLPRFNEYRKTRAPQVYKQPNQTNERENVSKPLENCIEAKVYAPNFKKPTDYDVSRQPKRKTYYPTMKWQKNYANNQPFVDRKNYNFPNKPTGPRGQQINNPKSQNFARRPNYDVPVKPEDKNIQKFEQHIDKTKLQDQKRIPAENFTPINKSQANAESAKIKKDSINKLQNSNNYVDMKGRENVDVNKGAFNERKNKNRNSFSLNKAPLPRPAHPYPRQQFRKNNSSNNSSRPFVKYFYDNRSRQGKRKEFTRGKIGNHYPRNYSNYYYPQNQNYTKVNNLNKCANEAKKVDSPQQPTNEGPKRETPKSEKAPLAHNYVSKTPPSRSKPSSKDQETNRQVPSTV